MANATEEGLAYVCNEIVKRVVPDYLLMLTDDLEYHPWLFAFIGSALVGLSGIFPLLVIPIDDKSSVTSNANSPSLKVLLSFAVGALLGDVFLHLLPEAWLYAMQHNDGGGHVSLKCGLWVLCGLLLFIIVEKLFAEPGAEEPEPEPISKVATDKKPKVSSGKGKHKPSVGSLEIEDMYRLVEAEKVKREKLLGGDVKNGGAILCDDGEAPLYESCLFNNNMDSSEVSCGLVLGDSNVCGGLMTNGVIRGRCLKGNRWIGRTIRENQTVKVKDGEKERTKHVAGYLNLLANSIDNFTHGLAVGGSFLVSFRVGMLSTFAILVHEIPHEVGDFAILLRSGFSRWEAAKAQLITATGGLFGAMTAVAFSGASNTLEAKTSWILPFTAGGFLHIALITVLPDLLKEENPLESLKQLTALIAGIVIMGTLTVLVD